MSHDVDRKIKEILDRAKGQVKLTETAVRTLIERDPKFTLALVAPYLDGIIAHAIERARKQIGTTEAAPQAKKPLAKTAPIKTKPISPAQTSGTMDGLLNALARKFDAEPAEKNASGTNVSDAHIQAMNALVKKTKK